MLLRQGSYHPARPALPTGAPETNGIDVRADTHWGAFGSRLTGIVETPVRIEGGRYGDVGRIGAFTYINSNATLRYIETIGRFCAIGPDLVCGYPEHSIEALSPHILFPDFDSEWASGFHSLGVDPDREKQVKLLRDDLAKSTKKKIVIGNDVWIGGRVTIARGVHIGDGAVIATGSVVVKDVGPYEIHAGVPARHLRMKFDQEIVDRLLQIQWWRYGPDILKGLDISRPGLALAELEKRVSFGFPEYRSDEYHIEARKDVATRIPCQQGI
ncbi:Streptogramin A acetyltransferase [Agrobacterium sp. DSM 25558]|uniref:CatB-related O-acetyltransferase n=1 Tax=Agrobacterium sp. DSM 25558 TaxID=1907665 RepID=UPI0009725CEF|nr:CatB-related O-acetyltransferase [Agrobacterium sp. DSM 25558]SCX30467.1 Streptogramin A acetyltransferase [Agrobacterium sp. DSM 25558]